MKTNRFFYSVLLSSVFLIANTDTNAQNSLGKTDDVGRIAIKTIMPNLDIPSAAKKILLTRMTQIASKNGLASYGSRFIMYPRVDIITKDILASAPPKHVYTLNVSLRIADNLTKTIYSTTDITLKGVDNNETKAYISALKGLSYRHRDVKDFITEGKNRIIEYYNSQCDFIIKEAEALASRKEYDEAKFSSELKNYITARQEVVVSKTRLMIEMEKTDVLTKYYNDKIVELLKTESNGFQSAEKTEE